MKAKSPMPKLNRQILDEASDWFVDFRVGDIDSHARERFDQWLRRSPDHIRAYIEIAKTYVDLPALRADQTIDANALIAAARNEGNVVALGSVAGESVSRRIDANSQSAYPVSRARRHWIRHIAAAASVVFVCVAGALLWAWMHRYPIYATEIGENRSITLSDGSTIDLNARSRVQVRFSNGKRDVDLIEGQALFEVAHDAARPFVVTSGGAMVRAVGTQFDVYRGARGTTVTVVEGRVAVADRHHTVGEESGAPAAVYSPTYVSAGEQVIVTAQAISTPKRADIAAATAWTQHRLIFDATPLAEVVDHFNRFNTRRLIIEDSQLNDIQISGVYASADPTSLIRFLREQPGILITESEDAVRISRR